MILFIRFLVFLVTLLDYSSGQSYEDKRCKCVCPSPADLFNHTSTTVQKLYISNVPPSRCDCDAVVLPLVGAELRGREAEFCIRCECKYEIRNTTVIKVVVIIVVCLIVLLIIYMGFLMLLDPFTYKRRTRPYTQPAPSSEEATNLLLQGDESDNNED